MKKSVFMIPVILALLVFPLGVFADEHLAAAAKAAGKEATAPQPERQQSGDQPGHHHGSGHPGPGEAPDASQPHHGMMEETGHMHHGKMHMMRGPMMDHDGEHMDRGGPHHGGMGPMDSPMMKEHGGSPPQSGGDAPRKKGESS